MRSRSFLVWPVRDMDASGVSELYPFCHLVTTWPSMSLAQVDHVRFGTTCDCGAADAIDESAEHVGTLECQLEANLLRAAEKAVIKQPVSSYTLPNIRYRQQMEFAIDYLVKHPYMHVVTCT